VFNIIIPCAGKGLRFKEANYLLPKPLIDVGGKPMIERVVNSLGIDGNYIFCCLTEHEEKFGISKVLQKIVPSCTIVWVDRVTEGALSTCLLAEKYINKSNPLIIANSDQIVNFDPVKFIGNTLYYDGTILTFFANHPKWSYVTTDNKGRINSVVEKEVVSTMANVGVYSWKHGDDFVHSAKEMIKRDIRTNGEFYLAPSYNLLIEEGKHIQAQQVMNMLPCGAPSDLEQSIKILAMQEFRARGGHIFTREIK
jgi:NDP-sugar pyrophosphorylase family protein